MKKIKLTKVENLINKPHPNEINEGYTIKGYLFTEPEVGKSVFLFDSKIGLVSFYTSTVTEIIDDNTFRTLNSIYHYKEIS